MNLRLMMHIMVIALAAIAFIVVAPVIRQSAHPVPIGLGVFFGAMAVILLNLLLMLKK